MGYFETTVLYWCPNGYDFESLAIELERKTTVSRVARAPLTDAVGGVNKASIVKNVVPTTLYLREWYKLPSSEGLESIFGASDDSPIVIYRGGPTDLELVTMTELFQAPVPSEAVDLAITQFGELARLVGSNIGAESAWLTPVLGRPHDALPYLEKLSTTSIFLFPNSDSNFVLFGCRSVSGFRVFVEKRLSRLDNP